MIIKRSREKEEKIIRMLLGVFLAVTVISVAYTAIHMIYTEFAEYDVANEPIHKYNVNLGDYANRPYRDIDRRGFPEGDDGSSKDLWGGAIVVYAALDGDPVRVVMKRKDGILFAALNPKKISLKVGDRVNLNKARFWTGPDWLTEYLEIESVEPREEINKRR